MAKKDTPQSSLPRQLAEAVDQLFDQLIHRPWGFRRTEEDAWNPQLDLYETEDAFILEADLPGVREPDVSVTIENGELVLQGRRAFERVLTKENFHYHERRSGQFIRRLPLPASVNQERIHAEFHEGVLYVTLPKLPQKETPKS
jgi:HSP20 family protein